MSPILKAFLKAGWIQIGEDIPVFFKYNEDEYPDGIHYPFHVIFSVDAYSYFHLYDKWIGEGKIKEHQLTEEYINGIIRSAFEHSFISPKNMNIFVTDILFCHYKHNSLGVTDYNLKNKKKAEEYNEIYLYLLEKKRKDGN
jgi:hypothetical protein